MSDGGPKVDPATLALRASPRPVTRLNRRTVAALMGAVGLIVFLATMWALQPNRGKKPDSGPELQATQQVTHADGLQTLPRDYASIAKVPQLGPPAGEFGRPVLREEQAAGIASESGADQPDFRPNSEVDANRVERLRQQDEAEAAAKAQVFFQTGQHSRDAGNSADSAPAPRSLPESDLPSSPGASPSVGAPLPPRDDVVDQNQQDHKQSFINHTSDPKIYSSAALQTPRSPYQIMAGTIIPAALVTGINSDLPGEIIATVTQNVYDTVTGRYLLLPQGSRLLGQYDSQVTYGQRRVLLVWTRILMPDGSSMVLERLPGVDMAGYSGVEDGVNWHWGQIFVGAVLTTLLGVNAQLVAANTNTNSGSIVIATRQSAQDSVNQVGQQITRKNLSIQPTLTARPGLPVNVIVNKDIVLRPYS
jgi:type IV secretory pathway VirB10-like protein